jgi:hypothetical protein
VSSPDADSGAVASMGQLRERHGDRLVRALGSLSTVLHVTAGATIVLLLLWTVATSWAAPSSGSRSGERWS